jgi:hypothetical protein
MDWLTKREAFISKMAKLENKSFGQEETTIYVSSLQNTGNW